MLSPDLIAIVEAVASTVRFPCAEHDSDEHTEIPDDCAECEQVSRIVARQSVTATLLALTPMVDDWVALAKDNADIGERAENLSEKAAERGYYTEALARSADARVAYTAGNTLLSCASTLRSLIEGAK